MPSETQENITIVYEQALGHVVRRDPIRGNVNSGGMILFAGVAINDHDRTVIGWAFNKGGLAHSLAERYNPESLKSVTLRNGVDLEISPMGKPVPLDKFIDAIERLRAELEKQNKRSRGYGVAIPKNGQLVQQVHRDTGVDLSSFPLGDSFSVSEIILDGLKQHAATLAQAPQMPIEEFKPEPKAGRPPLG
jgi:hypothetical protein